MRLVVSLGRNEYPTLSVSFDLLIQQATCNCNLIQWDQPTIVTMNTKLMKSPVETKTLTKAAVNAQSE